MWTLPLVSIQRTPLYSYNNTFNLIKVKCALVQALRRCTGRTAHRGSRGIAVPFHDHGTRRGWGVSVRPQPLFTHGKDPVPIVQGVGWAPGPVWTGAENLAPTGIRSPDSPARSCNLIACMYLYIVTQRQTMRGMCTSVLCVSSDRFFDYTFQSRNWDISNR
jgi:hypothetical protein